MYWNFSTHHHQCNNNKSGESICASWQKPGVRQFDRNMQAQRGENLSNAVNKMAVVSQN